MKKNNFLVPFLTLFIALSPLSAYAGVVALNRMLGTIDKWHSTSLQKLDAITGYKGQTVKGAGSIKDVVKSYVSENEAMVYLQKSFRGKEYEIVLTVDRESIENTSIGKTVEFEGIFEGMSFKTLRFKDARIITITKAWWWPF